MSYRIEYTQGNGYRCSCCRRTWREETEFSTYKEALHWYMTYDIREYEDSDDVCIDHVYKLNEKGKVERELDTDKLDAYKKHIRKKTPNCLYCSNEDKKDLCKVCTCNKKIKQHNLLATNNFVYNGAY